MTLSTEESKSLNIAMAYKGFTKYETNFFDSSEYQELLTILNSFPQDILVPLDSPDYDAVQILKIGKEIIEKHTDKQNLLVSSIDTNILKPYKKDLMSPSQYNEIIKTHLEHRSVTEIPVDFYLDNPNEKGNAFMYLPFEEKINDIDYYRKLPIITSRITLSGSPINLRICSYVHEMCHALNYRNKGYTNNQLYDEVLSVFLELVTAVDLNNTSLRDVKLLQRVLSLKSSTLAKELYEKDNTNPLTIIDYNKYLISTLLAFHLFSIYLTKQRIRKEMDRDLNAIFNGDITLEDMLEKYEATEENGVQTLKKVTSYLRIYK